MIEWGREIKSERIIKSKRIIKREKYRYVENNKEWKTERVRE